MMKKPLGDHTDCAALYKHLFFLGLMCIECSWLFCLLACFTLQESIVRLFCKHCKDLF